jgi:AraC-like DNA-binding protein/mannose-6-phosphate isomerase-like protein (cupin superfamily)
MKRIPVRHIAKEEQELVSTGTFRIREVAELFGEGDLMHDLHRHDFFFVLALRSGEGVHEIDFEPFNVRDNSLFFMRPGQVHQLRLKKGSAGYLLEFNHEFYRPENKQSRQRLLKASNKNYCTLDADRSAKLQAILKQMFEEYREKLDSYQEAIQAQLELLLIELVRQSSNPDKNGPDAGNYAQQRLEEFMDLLEKNITTKKQASQYADLMHLSLFQLNSITKATIGNTASDMISNHIILEAKRHLLATSNQVKDIAYELGYEDVSYFTRYFKKQTGYTPESFRQKTLS